MDFNRPLTWTIQTLGKLWVRNSHATLHSLFRNVIAKKKKKKAYHTISYSTVAIFWVITPLNFLKCWMYWHALYNTRVHILNLFFLFLQWSLGTCGLPLLGYSLSSKHKYLMKRRWDTISRFTMFCQWACRGLTTSTGYNDKHNKYIKLSNNKQLANTSQDVFVF